MTIYGQYRDSSNQTPAFDPGAHACCFLCGRLLSDPSLPVVIGDIEDSRLGVSFFYRIHQQCAATWNKAEIDDIVKAAILYDRLALLKVQHHETHGCN